MNRLSKRLMISLFTLVLTFVALGATTFAWFSLGTTAKVNDFEVNIKGSEGLEIALGDSTSWYSTLNNEVVTNYIKSILDSTNEGKTTGKIKMDSVTSEDGKTFYKGNTITGNSFVHDNTTTAQANKDYLQMTIRLRTKTKNAINLDFLTVTGQQVDWVVDQSFTLAKSGTLLVPSAEGVTPVVTTKSSLVDALRVSLDYGLTPADVLVLEQEETVSLTNTKGTLATIVEGEDPDFTTRYIGGLEYFAIRSGYGTTGNISLTPQTGWAPVGTTKEFGTGLEALLFPALLPSDPLTGYREVTLKLNVWFEGYDNEAFDYVLGQALSIGLGFKLV